MSFKTKLNQFITARDNHDLLLQELLEMSFEQALNNNLDYIKQTYNAVSTQQRKHIREYFLAHTEHVSFDAKEVSFKKAKKQTITVTKHVAFWLWKKEQKDSKPATWNVDKRYDGFIKQLEKHDGGDLAERMKLVKDVATDDLINALLYLEEMARSQAA